ncbi:LADA_0C06172g1_1 [Lachancea dasiensis]|uniref:LADA_0C06172g1_1 n=1 Tax=Lachancea dasiensis TaxID=1072105 RepID=A0A1G4IZG1_9SACH|nr:LADA_0C06172g1_1 [Lachancea dasiensis]
MSFRDALNVYVEKPETRAEDVIFYDSHVSIVKDRYAKSECHLLVIPRNQKLSITKAWALKTEEKEKLQPYIDRALNHLFKTFTRKHAWKAAALKPFETNAQFLNFDFFVNTFTQVGVHSVPSMNNLHIHVMTLDFHSQRLKNKKHYNSFNTEFFKNWEQLPIDTVDTRHMEDAVIKKSELKCVYCQENFKNRFSQLKLHLDQEFRKRFD